MEYNKLPDIQVATDINQVEITSLSRIKGQKQVVDLLRVNLDAYFNSRSDGTAPAFGPVLLCGPSGTGKSLNPVSAAPSNANVMPTTSPSPSK